MKFIIKLICSALLLFCLSSLNLFSQVAKLKSTAISYKYNVNGWSDWSDWEETSVLITIDMNNDRITIYSKDKQVYDVVKIDETTYDKEGNKILALYCVDKAGLTCVVKLVKLKSYYDSKQLYVEYGDIIWVYDVYALE